MSKKYNLFMAETHNSNAVIQKAKAMRAVSEDFAEGFASAMWEAREIFMRIEDYQAKEDPDKETRDE